MGMKAIRLHLTQKSAHYRKEETVDNKMTYPLPFPSTVIGALHAACGYRSYHPMDISIQGKYDSMQRETYVDHCFLNTVMDDRGTLVKLENGDLLSAGFTKVAKAKKSQGNSFKNNVTIEIFDASLLTEYQDLKALRERLDSVDKQYLIETCAPLENRIKDIQKLQKANPNADEIDALKIEQKELKDQVKALKEAYKQKEKTEYTDPMNCFMNLTTGLKYYEVLYDVELMLHISASEEILQDILNNISNLQSLGRSEDFVNIEECVLVDLSKDEDNQIFSHYSMYIHQDDFFSEAFSTGADNASGTKYYANKNYVIDGKTGCRKFVKVPVVFGKEPVLDGEEMNKSSRLWTDSYKDNEVLIVDFL